MAKQSKLWCALLAAFFLTAMFTACSKDPNVRKQKYVDSGDRFYEKGKYREAAIEYQNAKQIDDRFADAHYKLALAEMKLGQFQGAVDELIRTLELQPEHFTARLRLANLFLQSSSWQLAKEHLDILRQQQPTAEVYVAIANYDALGNDMAGALASMQTAIRLDPNRAESYLNLGMLQARGEQWDAAEANYRKAVALDPKSTLVAVALGNFYQARGRYAEAEQLFRQAIANAPSDPEPRASLASLFFPAENKYTQAEDTLRQAKKDLPNNSDAYLMLGSFYMATSRFEQALAEFADLYKNHPKDAGVKKLYIQVLIKNNRLDEARKLNDETLKATPDDIDAQISKGQIETGSGKASAAINTLQAVLKSEPNHAIGHYFLGMAFDANGNASQAEVQWREAVRLRPELPEAHRALAEAAEKRGDGNALALEADLMISSQPDNPDGYLLRAKAEMFRKQLATAEVYINRALQKSPGDPAASIAMGGLRLAQNNPAEAQKAFQQALDQDPSSYDAVRGLMDVSLIQKQPDKAAALAKSQIDKYPNNSGFHYLLGQVMAEHKNDPAGAEMEFKRAAELDKGNLAAILELGSAQAQQGKTDQALTTYLQAAQANPKATDFIFRAGQVYENQKDWDKAKQSYRHVLELEPENAFASNQLAYVMLEQGGNVDVALSMAQAARRQYPNVPGFCDTLGWAYYHKGVYNSAVDLFKEALKGDPKNPTYTYHLGLAYAGNGQSDQARKQLDLLLKIKPDYPDASKLRQALAESKT